MSQTWKDQTSRDHRRVHGIEEEGSIGSTCSATCFGQRDKDLTSRSAARLDNKLLSNSSSSSLASTWASASLQYQNSQMSDEHDEADIPSANSLLPGESVSVSSIKPNQAQSNAHAHPLQLSSNSSLSYHSLNAATSTSTTTSPSPPPPPQQQQPLHSSSSQSPRYTLEWESTPSPNKRKKSKTFAQRFQKLVSPSKKNKIKKSGPMVGAAPPKRHSPTTNHHHNNMHKEAVRVATFISRLGSNLPQGTDDNDNVNNSGIDHNQQREEWMRQADQAASLNRLGELVDEHDDSWFSPLSSPTNLASPIPTSSAEQDAHDGSNSLSLVISQVISFGAQMVDRIKDALQVLQRVSARDTARAVLLFLLFAALLISTTTSFVLYCTMHLQFYILSWVALYAVPPLLNVCRLEDGSFAFASFIPIPTSWISKVLHDISYYWECLELHCLFGMEYHGRSDIVQLEFRSDRNNGIIHEDENDGGGDNNNEHEKEEPYHWASRANLNWMILPSLNCYPRQLSHNTVAHHATLEYVMSHNNNHNHSNQNNAIATEANKTLVPSSSLSRSNCAWRFHKNGTYLKENKAFHRTPDLLTLLSHQYLKHVKAFPTAEHGRDRHGSPRKEAENEVSTTTTKSSSSRRRAGMLKHHSVPSHMLPSEHSSTSSSRKKKNRSQHHIASSFEVALFKHVEEGAIEVHPVDCDSSTNAYAYSLDASKGKSLLKTAMSNMKKNKMSRSKSYNSHDTSEEKEDEQHEEGYSLSSTARDAEDSFSIRRRVHHDSNRNENHPNHTGHASGSERDLSDPHGSMARSDGESDSLDDDDDDSEFADDDDYDDDDNQSFATTTSSVVLSPGASSGAHKRSNKQSKKHGKKKTEVNWIDVGARLGIRLLGTDNMISNLLDDDEPSPPALVATDGAAFADLHANTNRMIENNGKDSIVCDNGSVILPGGGMPMARSPKTMEQANLLLRANSPSTVHTHILPPVHSMWTSPSAAASRLVSSSSKRAPFSTTNSAKSALSPPSLNSSIVDQSQEDNHLQQHDDSMVYAHHDARGPQQLERSIMDDKTANSKINANGNANYFSVQTAGEPLHPPPLMDMADVSPLPFASPPVPIRHSWPCVNTSTSNPDPIYDINISPIKQDLSIANMSGELRLQTQSSDQKRTASLDNNKKEQVPATILSPRPEQQQHGFEVTPHCHFDNNAAIRRNSVTSKKSLPATFSPQQHFLASPARKVPAPKRPILAHGVKMVVPIFPNAAHTHQKSLQSSTSISGYLQMGTVLSCRRMHLPSSSSSFSSSRSTVSPYRRASAGFSLSPSRSANLSTTPIRGSTDTGVAPPRTLFLPAGGLCADTNCLEIRLALDKSYLRKGKFAQMTIRIPDGFDDGECDDNVNNNGIGIMPPHSKFPIGSCVATSFGLGVLVGWRVEDDCHLVRSLWQRRGSGAASAYLSRDAVHGVVEAACGFKVLTPLGKGEVLGYVNAGRDFLHGRFFVAIKSRLKYNHGHGYGRVGGVAESTHIIGFGRSDILACPSAKFIPILEQIREAANYQLQLEEYKVAVRAMQTRANGSSELNGSNSADEDWLPVWVGALEKGISCVVRAVDQDPNFNREMNTFVASAIRMMEQLDINLWDSNTGATAETVNIKAIDASSCTSKDQCDAVPVSAPLFQQPKKAATKDKEEGDNVVTSVTWMFDELVGQLFGGAVASSEDAKSKAERPFLSAGTSSPGGKTFSFYGSEDVSSRDADASLEADAANNAPNEMIDWPAAMGEGDIHRPFGVIRTLTRALTIARLETESENMRMVFSSCIELLLFTRAILRVRKTNVSAQTLANRKQTTQLLRETFGPIKARLLSFGEHVLQWIEKKGRRAKVRFARCIDILVRDDVFMTALEKSDWDVFIAQLERAVVKARILDAKSCAQVRESALIIYGSLAPSKMSTNNNQSTDQSFDSTSGSGPAAKDSNKNGSFASMAAKVMKWIAAPRRTILHLLKRDDVLELLERILVRVFGNKDDETQMLNIYAFNFHSFRQLFVLKNMAVASSLWMQFAETAHNEFTWFVSRMSDTHFRVMGTHFAKLFGLGILHMKSIFSGRTDAADWLDFLMEENAIQIIQEMDQKIVSVVEEVCKDIKSAMNIMPYYAR
jgi:hypothetical protein